MLDETRPAPVETVRSDTLRNDSWLTAWAVEIPRALSGIAKALQGGRLTDPILHRSRRDLKRLRSLLRLAPRSSFGLAEQTRNVTGELRRRLGHTRDATVMQKTLRVLADELGETAARIKPVLSAHHRIVSGALHRSSRRGDRDRIMRLQSLWRGRSCRGDVSDLHLQAVRTYARARRRAAKLGHGEIAALHPLRKACVDHQNHLDFFAKRPDGKIAARHDTVKKLRDQLGLCNDLEVLRDFVRTRADISAGDLIKLEEVLAKHHRRLVAKAVKLSGKLFDGKPRIFGKWLKREIEKSEADAARPEARSATETA